MNPLSALSLMAGSGFEPQPCPACGSSDGDVVLKRDRYLLPICIGVCGGCGFVYTRSNLGADRAKQFYEREYREFYEEVAQIDKRYLFRAKDKTVAGYRYLRIAEVVGDFERVAELGSGLGFFLDECRSHGLKHYVGIEPGAKFREFSQRQLQLPNVLAGVSPQGTTELPFKPDLLVAFHVLEHLSDPGEYLDWMRRNLDPNGSIVIEVPDIAGHWDHLGVDNFHIAHRQYFSAESIGNMLANHGLYPYYMSRDDVDGVYPGNLRVFASPRRYSADYPLTQVEPKSVRQSIERRLRARVRVKGYARAAGRMAKRVLVTPWR